MERLTIDGLFCDLAVCQEVPCKYPDEGCSQRQVWERLKNIEDILCDNFDTYDLTRLKELVEADKEDVAPVVHGRWMPAGRGIVACTECNHGIWEHMALVNHYCPNCGAKMDMEDTDNGNEKQVPERQA